jgi:hypothetical protein
MNIRSSIKIPVGKENHLSRATPTAEISPESTSIVLPNLKEEYDEDFYLAQLSRGRPVGGYVVA